MSFGTGGPIAPPARPSPEGPCWLEGLTEAKSDEPRLDGIVVRLRAADRDRALRRAPGLAQLVRHVLDEGLEPPAVLHNACGEVEGDVPRHLALDAALDGAQ